MKTFPFLLCFLFIGCLLSSLSSTVSAQFSTTNYVAPDTAQPRAEQAPLTRTRKAAEWESVRVVRLNQLNTAEQQQLVEQKAGSRKAFRIGITRPLPRHIESLSDFTAQPTAQGTLYLLRLVSPGAKSLRLHFRNLQLPAGAHLFVSSRQNVQVFSPAYTDKQTDFWTPSLPGEEIIIECFLPRNATLEKSSPPFVIDTVNHIFRAPRETNSAQIESAAECNQPVPDEFREAAKATALIAFAKPDGEYVCSGTLLADIKKTGTPYFLTANHCISNGGEASSAEVYWNYDSGSFPTSEPTRWARLLVTDEAEDFTFLQLNSNPPGGVVYSGWTSVPQAIGTAVTGIHHPRADYKRAAFGKLVEAACPSEIPAEICELYTKVQWDRGITEPGSSGSGLFIGTGSQTQLVGLLSGGKSSCETPTGADFYGQMSRIHEALGYYLTNGEVCRYSLLQDRFAYAAAGDKGETTVVPKLGGENCPWQAQSNVSWITLTNASGNGLGKVTFQVAANTSDKQRIGIITVAGRNIIIRQNPSLPSDSCSPTKIVFGQTVSDDLNTTTCRSWFNQNSPAIRYSFDGEAAQTFTLQMLRGLPYAQFHLIGPDGLVKQIRDIYAGIGFTVTGTYILEISLSPLAHSVPGTFSFMLNQGCTYKFSPTYFEVDAFGLPLTGGPGFARMNAEITGGSTCPFTFEKPDEAGIDDGKVYSSYYPGLNAVLLQVAEATDPRQRYYVVRVADQPIIIRQIPRCNSETKFTYTPSAVSVPGAGGQFQLQVKRTSGPSCTYQVVPYDINDATEDFSRLITILPNNTGGIRRTDDSLIEYQVPLNDSLKTRRFLMKADGQPVQSLTQPTIRAACAPMPLQVGQTVNGQITSTDCAWTQPDEYLQVYQLNVLPGEQFAVEMSPTGPSAIYAEIAQSDQRLFDSQIFFRTRWPDRGFRTASSEPVRLYIFGKPGSYRLSLAGVGPPGCVYTLDKTGESLLVPGEATSASVQLTSNRGDCTWTAQSSANGVTFPNGTSGQGSQTITMAFTPNTGTWRRSTTITIAGRTFSLVQDYPCSYRHLVTPAPDKLYASYLGGEYNYNFTTGETCPALTATSNTDWIQVSSLQKLLTLKVNANPGGFRKATIKVEGKDYEVLQGGNDLVVTTAADYQRTVASGSLVSLFNEGLATRIEAARSVPLPYSLGGASLFIRTSNGNTYAGSLLYASPTQINFFLPEHFPAGRAQIRIESDAVRLGGTTSATYAIGEFDIVSVAPNVFTADSTGKGPAAGDIQRIRPGQPVVYESTFTTAVDEQGKPMVVARPINIGEGEEKTYLVLYATGVRKRDTSVAVTAQIGDVTLPVEYAGAQGQFVGLDQINILLPPSLRGKGLVNVTVTIEGKTTNPVQINIAP